MTLVGTLIGVRGQQAPGTVALLAGADGRQVTWADLVVEVERWSALAAGRQLAPRSRIGLVVDDPLTFSAAYLGCLGAGLGAVPLDPGLTLAELVRAAARLRTDVVATDRGDVLADVVEVETWALSSHGPRVARRLPVGPRPADGVPLRPAALLASSGTTGEPKGIPLSEYQLMHAAQRIVGHHRLGPSDRGYTPLPLFHVNAQVVGLLTTLVGGGSLVVDRRFVGDEYWERVSHWRPTWLNAVPAVLASLLAEPSPPCSVSDGVRFARSASAPLSRALLEDFQSLTGVGVLETYGTTEAASQVTANPLQTGRRRPGSVGLPVGLGLTVTTEEGRPARPGQVGAVRLAGRPLVSHYIGLSATGPETLHPARDAGGWLSTGDLGQRDDDGFLQLVGRTDDVINRGGEKLYPREVEEILATHPAVASVAVVGAPHPRLGQVPVGFVTIRPGAASGISADALTDQLQRLCQARLARYKRPTEIHVASSLPTGPTGKILRRGLSANGCPGGGADWSTAHAAPADPAPADSVRVPA